MQLPAGPLPRELSKNEFYKKMKKILIIILILIILIIIGFIYFVPMANFTSSIPNKAEFLMERARYGEVIFEKAEYNGHLCSNKNFFGGRIDNWCGTVRLYSSGYASHTNGNSWNLSEQTMESVKEKILSKNILSKDCSLSTEETEGERIVCFGCGSSKYKIRLEDEKREIYVNKSFLNVNEECSQDLNEIYRIIDHNE